MSVTDPDQLVVSSVNAIVDRRTVERNVLSHLQQWLVPYLAAMERFHGLDTQSIPTPKAWRVEQQFARRPQDHLPFVAVVSSGINPGKTPAREGDGMTRAWWLVAIGAVCGARSDQMAKDLSGYYGAAIRMAMMHVPDLGGWSSGVDWNDERYDDWSPILEQVVSSVRLVFTVEVEQVVNVFEGFRDMWGKPTVPPDPYNVPTSYPDITEKQITVDKLD